MTFEICGIELLDGPLGPWKNGYPMEWPLPDEIVVFMNEGVVAVTTVGMEQRAKEEFGAAYRYRKVAESQLPRPTDGMMRGATYRIVDNGDS